jgi:DNA-binding transcriptional ArsR family regulator
MLMILKIKKLENLRGTFILVCVTLPELARAFTALGSEDRLRIVAWLLGEERPSCEEIARELVLSRPAVSYHLRALEEAGLIVRTRRGRARCLELTPLLEELLHTEVVHQLMKEGERKWSTR